MKVFINKYFSLYWQHIYKKYYYHIHQQSRFKVVSLFINQSLAKLENIAYFRIFDFYKKFDNLFRVIRQLIVRDTIF